MRAIGFGVLATSLLLSLAAGGPTHAQKKGQKEKLSKETLKSLTAVRAEYKKRGVKSDVYDREGKTWVVFYFPDSITDKDLTDLPEPPIPCNFDLNHCRITDACIKELKK